MKALYLGIAAAVLIAVVAGVWLNTLQVSTAQQNTVAGSVRIN